MECRDKTSIVQPLYKTPHYNTDLDITQYVVAQKKLPWNFTKDL